MYKAFWCDSCATYLAYAEAAVAGETQISIINHRDRFLRLEADGFVLSEKGESLSFTCHGCGGPVELKSFEVCPHDWHVEKDLHLRRCWICHEVEYARMIFKVM